MSNDVPIALTDDQLLMIYSATEPLQPIDRSAFLNALAHRMRNEVVGDGSLGRAIRDLQKEFFRPPRERTKPPQYRMRVGAPIA